MRKKLDNKSQPILPKTASDKHQIPRNVNYYSHFLQESYITEKDIEWVLQLRNIDHQPMQDRLQRIPNIAFGVADKSIETMKLKHLSRDCSYKGNITPVLHLLKGRLGPTPQLSQAEFETGLRSYTLKDKSLTEKERQWTTAPKTQRKQEFPEFPPDWKEQQQKKKSMSVSGKLSKITYSGFDPDIHYPPYKMKFTDKNLQNVKHLFVPGTKMSTIQWQEGLRGLEQIKRPKQDKTNKQSKSNLK